MAQDEGHEQGARAGGPEHHALDEQGEHERRAAPGPAGGPGDVRVALITGAAGALATTTAEVFEAHGWRLALLARGEHEAALRHCFPLAQVVAVDLADAPACEHAVAAVLARQERIDALLNLVGGFSTAAAADTTDEELDRLLTLNLRTAHHITRAALPSMVARGEGFVLGVSARAAVTGGRRTTAYGAAKGAVTGYFRNLQAELEPQGVGVSLLFPMGTIDTEANRAAMPSVDPATFIDRRRLAEAIHFLATRSRRDRVRELQVGVG